MDVGFKYRKSGKLPKVKVPGTFYYLAKGGDKDELWFCFSDTLIKRVDNELLNADEVNAVIKEYLEKNGISLDGYATEKWVNQLVEKLKTNIESNYATKKELKNELDTYATKVDNLKTDIENVKSELGDYTTKKELETKLGDYATKTDVKTELDAYATKESVENLKTDIESNYATKDDVPTNLSDLVNDSGYINQIKTINGVPLTGDGDIEILVEVTQAGLEETLKDYVKKDDAAKKSVWEELIF